MMNCCLRGFCFEIFPLLGHVGKVIHRKYLSFYKKYVFSMTFGCSLVKHLRFESGATIVRSRTILTSSMEPTTKVSFGNTHWQQAGGQFLTSVIHLERKKDFQLSECRSMISFFVHLSLLILILFNWFPWEVQLLSPANRGTFTSSNG